MKNRVLLIGCWLSLLGAALPAEAPIRIDNGYADWRPLPSAARFSTHYNPFYFDSERDGKSEKLPIENALYWKKGGTQISEVKAYLDRNALYLSVESASPFARELSIFLYVYRGRDADAVNIVTLELVPSVPGRPGAVFLWQQGNTKPSLLGRPANTSIRLECLVPLDEMAQALSAHDLELLSFDLTTCYHESASGLFRFEQFAYCPARIWLVGSKSGRSPMRRDEGSDAVVCNRPSEGLRRHAVVF